MHVKETITSLASASPRVPPHNREAEMAVLGSMLVERESVLKAMDVLREDDFYDEGLRAIFGAIRTLHDRNITPDIVTLGDELERTERLSAVGGRALLIDLTNSVPAALHVEHYAKIVREKSLLRQMIRIAHTVTADCYQPGDEAQALLDKAQQAYFTLAQERSSRGMVGAGQLMQGAIAALEKLAEASKFVTGVSTGFSELDKLTSGLQPSNLIIIAGRPSMGKTAICLNIAEHVAIKEKRPVVFFSLEMSEQEIGLRLLCSQARINVRNVREGFLARKSWPTITNVASQIAGAPLYFDFATSPSILDIRSAARRWAHEMKAKGNPLALIVIDYIQLLHAGGAVESRQQEISEISRSIKALARELSVPVIALSQLNRRPEDRGREGRPQLSDLRECVTGDTLVSLADGRQKPIADLVGTEPRVLSVTPDGKLIFAMADKVWHVGRRLVRRLRLASGKSIDVTADHRLLTYDGWRRAAHIPVGELMLAHQSPSPLKAAHPDPHIERDRRSGPMLLGNSPFGKGGGRGICFLAPTEEKSPLTPLFQRGEKGLQNDMAQIADTLFWDRLISVDELGETDVFDLTVPGPASWIGNGIVSHNSGALEQDADVVAAIFREEVYKRDDPDLKGKAKLFLLKQRNGPIGDIDLNFLSEFTKFADPAPEGEPF